MEGKESSGNKLIIRPAVRQDIPLLMQFILEIAEYEKMLDEVVATEEILDVWMFEKRTADAFIAFWEGEPAGFSLYCYNFSTFLGRAGIYLEDLFVKPQFRGYGIGKALLTNLADKAQREGYGRLEWQCLDWNKPSIDFYLSMNAKPMEEWTTYRLAGETLKAAAEMCGGQ